LKLVFNMSGQLTAPKPEEKKRNKNLMLTEGAIRKLAELSERVGISESAVVELLIRKYGEKLVEEFKL